MKQTKPPHKQFSLTSFNKQYIEAIEKTKQIIDKVTSLPDNPEEDTSSTQAISITESLPENSSSNIENTSSEEITTLLSESDIEEIAQLQQESIEVQETLSSLKSDIGNFLHKLSEEEQHNPDKMQAFILEGAVSELDKTIALFNEIINNTGGKISIYDLKIAAIETLSKLISVMTKYNIEKEQLEQQNRRIKIEEEKLKLLKWEKGYVEEEHSNQGSSITGAIFRIENPKTFIQDINENLNKITDLSQITILSSEEKEFLDKEAYEGLSEEIKQEIISNTVIPQPQVSKKEDKKQKKTSKKIGSKKKIKSTKTKKETVKKEKKSINLLKNNSSVNLSKTLILKKKEKGNI